MCSGVVKGFTGVYCYESHAHTTNTMQSVYIYLLPAYWTITTFTSLTTRPVYLFYSIPSKVHYFYPHPIIMIFIVHMFLSMDGTWAGGLNVLFVYKPSTRTPPSLSTTWLRCSWLERCGQVWAARARPTPRAPPGTLKGNARLCEGPTGHNPPAAGVGLLDLGCGEGGRGRGYCGGPKVVPNVFHSSRAPPLPRPPEPSLTTLYSLSWFPVQRACVLCLCVCGCVCLLYGHSPLLESGQL